MPQVFTIPQDKIAVVTNKAILRTYKIVAITVIVFIALQLIAHRPLLIVLIPTAFTVAVFVIITLITKGRIRKAYESLEIVLDDQGVEWKSSMMRYKRILYSNMIIDEQYEGGINLYDHNYSSFQRKLNGQGWIKIPKEIGNINMLISALEQQIAVLITNSKRSS